MYAAHDAVSEILFYTILWTYCIGMCISEGKFLQIAHFQNHCEASRGRCFLPLVEKMPTFEKSNNSPVKKKREIPSCFIKHHSTKSIPGVIPLNLAELQWARFCPTY